MKKLLAGNLWPMLTTEPGQVRLQRLQSELITPLDRLIECLILYDEVVLPTQDMIIIPALINVLGEDSVRQLMDSGALKFLRVKRGFAYVPGKGVAVIEVVNPNGQKPPDSKDLEELVAWIATMCTGSKNPTGFLKSLLYITSEVDADEFETVIRDESEADVINSAAIRDLFGLPDMHPKDLPAKANTMMLYGGPEFADENPVIMSYLSLVQTNVEAALATRAECHDVFSATGLDTLLAEKFARAGHVDASNQVQLLSDIPDFAPIVRGGELPMQKLIKLRNSKHGEEFRLWFHEAVENGEDISKAYVDLIQQVHPTDSIPGKLTRIAVWTGTSTAVGTMVAPGPVGTVGGAVVGAVGGLFDAFVMDKIRLGGSAKVFLEKMSKMTNTPK